MLGALSRGGVIACQTSKTHHGGEQLAAFIVRAICSLAKALAWSYCRLSSAQRSDVPALPITVGVILAQPEVPA